MIMVFILHLSDEHWCVYPRQWFGSCRREQSSEQQQKQIQSLCWQIQEVQRKCSCPKGRVGCPAEKKLPERRDLAGPCSWAERDVIFWMNYFLTSGIVAIWPVFVIPQNRQLHRTWAPSVDNNQKGNLTRHRASDVTSETVTYHSRNSEWFLRFFLWQNCAYLSMWT